MKRLLPFSIVLMSVSLAACSPSAVAPTSTALSATASQTNAPLPPAATPTITFTMQPPVTTRIVIDGKADDWSGRPLLLEDPAGDAKQGYLDITKGYAFVNRDALYILLEVADPESAFVLFDMTFQADGRRLQVIYQPGQSRIFITENSSVRKYVENSTAAFKEALEVRLDLDDLGRPGQIEIMNIAVMAGSGGADWGPVDSWKPGIPPIVNEADPPRVGSEESRYSHARSWNLPTGYVGEPLLVSPLANNGYIARSRSGRIYTTMSWAADNGVSLIDAEKATATPILKLPSGIGISQPVGGPGDTIFLGVESSIWQINPDGSHKVWGDAPGTFPIYYTADNLLLGIQNGSNLVEINPDGSTVALAGGFQQIFDAIMTAEGIILVYDQGTGDIVRVDPNGARRVLARALAPGDFVNLGMDFDGQVYISSAGTYGLRRLDINTGQRTPIPSALSPCSWNPIDFVFTAPGKILFTGDQLSWADLATSENGVLIHGITSTFAAAIGADGALYLGAAGCGEQIPAQILRIADDGTKTVYVDNLSGTIKQIAFAPDGGLYIASLENDKNRLFHLPAGEKQPVEIPGVPAAPITSMAIDPASGNLLFTVPGGLAIEEYDQNGFVRRHDFHFSARINEFRLSFAPDGALFGLAGLGISPTNFHGPWILNLNLKNDSNTVFAELSHKATGVLSVFTIDSEGNIWVIINPDSILYKITPDGTATVFASNLPVDMPAIVADPSGDLYFTCATGVFRIYREP